jgi:metal-dependent amidase/aminoacylase/carboxypeptidase family protein
MNGNAKQGTKERLRDVSKAVLDLSHRIHANPELGFQEEKACSWLVEILDQNGFEVQSGTCDLPTAFVAKAGNGPLHVAICAEYDCLPQIGHACGHNMIAAMAVGSGIAAAQEITDLVNAKRDP